MHACIWLEVLPPAAQVCGVMNTSNLLGLSPISNCAAGVQSDADRLKSNDLASSSESQVAWPAGFTHPFQVGALKHLKTLHHLCNKALLHLYNCHGCGVPCGDTQELCSRYTA